MTTAPPRNKTLMFARERRRRDKKKGILNTEEGERERERANESGQPLCLVGERARGTGRGTKRREVSRSCMRASERKASKSKNLKTSERERERERRRRRREASH